MGLVAWNQHDTKKIIFNSTCSVWEQSIVTAQVTLKLHLAPYPVMMLYPLTVAYSFKCCIYIQSRYATHFLGTYWLAREFSVIEQANISTLSYQHQTGVKHQILLSDPLRSNNRKSQTGSRTSRTHELPSTRNRHPVTHLEGSL